MAESIKDVLRKAGFSSEQEELVALKLGEKMMQDFSKNIAEPSQFTAEVVQNLNTIMEENTDDNKSQNEERLKILKEQLKIQRGILQENSDLAAVSTDNLQSLNTMVSIADKEVAARKDNADEEFKRTLALTETTYNVGKAIRDMSKDGILSKLKDVGSRMTGGAKVFKEGQEGKNIFQKDISFKGVALAGEVLTKRLGALGMIAGGLVAENEGMLLAGALVQDKMNKVDELMTDREKEQEKAKKSLEAKAIEPLLEDFSRNEETGSPEQESRSETVAQAEAEAMTPEITKLFEAVDGTYVNTLYLEDIHRELVTMARSTDMFNRQILDVQKDNELARKETEVVETGVLPVAQPEIKKEKEEKKDFLGGMIGDKLQTAVGPFATKLSALAGPLMGVAVAGAVGIAIGLSINEGFKLMFGEQGLGGKIHEWINGSFDEVREGQVAEFEGIHEIAKGNSDQIEKERKELETELARMRSNLKGKKGALFGGNIFGGANKLEEEINMAQTKLNMLNRLNDEKRAKEVTQRGPTDRFSMDEAKTTREIVDESLNKANESATIEQTKLDSARNKSQQDKLREDIIKAIEGGGSSSSTIVPSSSNNTLPPGSPIETGDHKNVANELFRGF